MKNELLHEKRSFDNVRSLVEWAATEYGEKTAYSFKNKSSGVSKMSFTQLRDDVRALTSSLIRCGVSGKHCAVVGKFSYEWVLTYYSVLMAGGTLVPLDRDWQATDLAKTAAKAEVQFLFADGDIKDKSDAIAAACELSVPAVSLDLNCDDFATLRDDGKKIFEEDSSIYFNNPIDPDRMSLLVFTSGTTGEGKGVMLTQTAILSDICAVVPYMDFSDKTVGVLPPHHTYGSSVMIIGHTLIGCEIYISSGLRYVQKELAAEKPGHLVLVPLYLETFYRKIHANIKAQGKEKTVVFLIKLSNALRKIGIDLRKKLFAKISAAFGGEVKMIISGGAPISREIIDFFEALGISTLNGYGITECAPIIAVNRSLRNVPGTVGPVLDVNEVIINDANEAGEGEILVKGPNVMLGYYKNEEATCDAFLDGYFRTGDYGRLDGDVLTITGRKKNLIILSNGKNVYPEEIERDLIATPGILEIVVYEGQSKRGIENNAITAEIYPDPDFMKKNGITDARAHLMPFINEYNKNAVPYKKIGIVKIRDEEFPKNTLRKIMRFKLDMTID